MDCYDQYSLGASTCSVRDIHLLDGCNVSQVSMDSLLWQVQRLGPVLSSRYLTRNLLRMLALCYVDDNSLNPLESNPLEGSLLEATTNPLKESNVFQMCGTSIQVRLRSPLIKLLYKILPDLHRDPPGFVEEFFSRCLPMLYNSFQNQEHAYRIWNHS